MHLTVLLCCLLAGLNVESLGAAVTTAPCLLARFKLDEDAGGRVTAMAPCLLAGLNVEDAGFGKLVATAPGRSSMAEKREPESS